MKKLLIALLSLSSVLAFADGTPIITFQLGSSDSSSLPIAQIQAYTDQGTGGMLNFSNPYVVAHKQNSTEAVISDNDPVNNTLVQSQFQLFSDYVAKRQGVGHQGLAFIYVGLDAKANPSACGLSLGPTPVPAYITLGQNITYTITVHIHNPSTTGGAAVATCDITPSVLVPPSASNSLASGANFIGGSGARYEKILPSDPRYKKYVITDLSVN